AVGHGYEAYLLFIVQMKGIRILRPNDETDPQFGDALRRAAAAGVKILAVDCLVTDSEVTAADPVAIDLC
ncbi:MAG: DNA/RNA nuclease SfsA, partial [Oscillospiraceae bacterium]|nr:DNA/RNA nuclease SfsA [Oscillospiraceae bacterium]